MKWLSRLPRKGNCFSNSGSFILCLICHCTQRKGLLVWIPFIGMRQILWIWILLFLFRTLLRLHHPNFLGNCKMQKIINVSVIITGDYKRLGESFVVYHRCQGGSIKRKAALYSRNQLLIGCWLFTWSPVNRFSSCPSARNIFFLVIGVFLSFSSLPGTFSLFFV